MGSSVQTSFKARRSVATATCAAEGLAGASESGRAQRGAEAWRAFDTLVAASGGGPRRREGRRGRVLAGCDGRRRRRGPARLDDWSAMGTSGRGGVFRPRDRAKVWARHAGGTGGGVPQGASSSIPEAIDLSSTVTGRTRHRSTRSEAVAHSQRKASAISESRRRECESNEWSQCGWGERARERARVTGGVYPVWGMIARRAAWRLGWRRARDRRAQGQARRGNGGWRHGECRLVFLRFPRGFSPAPRLSGVGGGRARSTRLTADVVR